MCEQVDRKSTAAGRQGGRESLSPTPQPLHFHATFLTTALAWKVKQSVASVRPSVCLSASRLLRLWYVADLFEANTVLCIFNTVQLSSWDYCRKFITLRQSFSGKSISHFPPKTFPGKTFPGEITFPEWAFLGKTFPAKSFSRKVVFQKDVSLNMTQKVTVS